MNQIIDFKAKTQALDALRFERIYLDMSKFAHTYFATQVEPLNLIGVCPKLDTPPKWSNVFEWQIVKTLKNVMSNHVSNHSDIANMPKYGYICRALSKISKLALAGYKLRGVQPTFHSGFFVRYISMRPHIYVELGRDIFGCAGNLVVLSANPFKLHTNHLAVICEAPQLQGAH